MDQCNVVKDKALVVINSLMTNITLKSLPKELFLIKKYPPLLGKNHCPEGAGAAVGTGYIKPGCPGEGEEYCPTIDCTKIQSDKITIR